MPRTPFCRLWAEALEDRTTPVAAVALSGSNLLVFDTATPAATTTTPITNVAANETLVGIDFRPQNGHLYALGVNATGTGTLYDISTRTGRATPVGSTGGVTTTDGLPNPTTAGFTFDFNPVVDLIRVHATDGDNFVISADTGTTVANQTAVSTALGLSGSGYTNNAPNATATTLYDIGAAADSLYIIPSPATGVANLVGALGVGDFTAVNGFDIPAGVNTNASGTPVMTGSGFAALTVGGVSRLYTVNLVTGAGTLVGTIGTGAAVSGLAVQNDYGGFPAIALSNATPGAANLVRFNTSTPGTTTTVAITGINAGDPLVGLDLRPSTGQLYALGVTAGGVGTLYLINPQTGSVITATTIAGITLPNPASSGYGFDFNPAVDAIRVVTATGLSFSINPTTAAVLATAPPIAGGTTTADAAAYTNNFGQTPGVGAPTTLYVLDAATDRLYIQNAATSVTTTVAPITVGGTPLDFTAVNGFDIPAGVTVESTGAAATGFGFATLVVGGTPRLYRINLATGEATSLGAVFTTYFGLTLADGPGGAVVRNLAVGGSPSGQVQLFTPSAAGLYGTSPAATLTPFAGFTGAVRTATGDVNGDGVVDTVVVTGPGTPIRLAVVSGADNATLLVQPFDPFGGGFTGGGFVAAGNLDGLGGAEFVVTPDQGGGPRVSVFSRNADGSVATRANFFGIDDANFRGGARAALGDVNRDGVPDVVVAAGFGGGPRTAIFTGQSVLAGAPVRVVGDFFAFPGADAVNLRNGSFVAAGDVTGDGFADLIFGGGPGGAPRVFILSGALVSAGDVAGAQASPVANFFVAGNAADRGGVRVAATTADGDARADVAVGSGAGSAARARVYLGKDFTGTGEPGTSQDLTPFGGAVLADGVYVG